MPPDQPKLSSRIFRKWFPVTFVLIGVAVMISCVTMKRVVLVPPEVKGATFIGSKSCEECHAHITKDFPSSTHARLMAHGPNAVNMGCESCHGAGSIHSESGGAHGTIINPVKSPEVCFNCHLDMRGKFNLPHSHPVLDGKMSCTQCHDPHKGDAIRGSAFALTAQQDTCGQCHIAQRGPFVFEHEAIREGCTTCHEPHGSINEKMLVQRNQNLCLKCHFQQQTEPGRIFIGGRDHSQFLSRGTCWTAGCHEAIHGSHIGSSLRF